ncbi:hypothetical protein J6590_086004, partial [Homalodisca vitripennis]
MLNHRRSYFFILGFTQGFTSSSSRESMAGVGSMEERATYSTSFLSLIILCSRNIVQRGIITTIAFTKCIETALLQPTRTRKVCRDITHDETRPTTYKLGSILRYLGREKMRPLLLRNAATT